MELLIARDLTIEREGRRLLEGASLTVRTGMRLGLVGPNGSGKSTLLDTLAGKRAPSAGYLRTAPGIHVAHLAQQRPLRDGRSAWEFALQGLERVRELESQLRREERLLATDEGSLERYGELLELFESSQGYAAEARLRESLEALGLAEDRLEDPVSTLSGGERRRLALARTLAVEPELLLLDEPSNHLDLPALRWLGERLATWRGGLLLVSHDRALLDELTTHTAGIEEGSLLVERGNFSRYRERRGNLLLRSERENRERDKRAQRLERTAAELRRWGNRGAQRRRRRIERELEEDRAARHQQGSSAGEAQRGVLQAREADGLLLEARSLQRDLGDRRLSVPHLRLEAGQKVALLGPNGSGKSTLLKLLAGEIASDGPSASIWRHRDSKLFHADQQTRGVHDDVALGEQLNALVRPERARMLLALCGLPVSGLGSMPDVLSAGERARAGLALILASDANLLLLDEPGNDLDLAAIETLQHALEQSDATVVLATHDRVLAALATEVWAIENCSLVEYRGGVKGYLAGRRRLEPELGCNAQGAGIPARGAGPGAREGSAPGKGSAPDKGSAPGKGLAPREGSGTAESSEPGIGGGDDSGEVDVERLELERMGLEERLLDPTLLSDREVERLRARLRATLDELSSLYDAALPVPGPSCSLKEAGVRVWANLTEDGLELGCEAPVSLRLVVHGDVIHLMLHEPEDLQQRPSCLLDWARGAVVDGAVRLVFYTLSPRAVQYHDQGPLRSTLLVPAGDGWWALTRQEFEAAEGWSSSASARSPSAAGSGSRA